LHFGRARRHAEIENLPPRQRFRFCTTAAAGIADVQVRNRGTIGGSLAEADPSGDWATVLLTLSCEVRCVGLTGNAPKAERISEGCLYYIAGFDELVSEVVVKVPQETR